MSKFKLRVARRVVSALTATATIVTVGGSAFVGLAAHPAVAPADFGLTEGDTISANDQTGDPDVYIVNENGYKRLFVNPQIFNLYGHLGFDKVKSVSAATRDAFPTSGLFRNCESDDQRVFGVEVVSEDVANLRWVNTSGAQAVIDDPHFFDKVFCINNAEQALYGTGPDYNSVNDVPDYARGETDTGPAGPFGATLSASNPASTTVLETQGLAPLAAFDVTGSGAVTTVVLQKLGIAGDATLSSVYLFVGGVRVSDGFTFSNNMLTFNDAGGFFNAPATLWVRANVADNTSGQTIGVGLYSVNGNSMLVSGNTHSIAANPSDLATVTVGAPNGGGDLDPQSDVKVWESDLSISSNPVILKRVSLRMIGSAPRDAVNNFRLFVDGVQIATAAGLDSNDYVHFILNRRLETSDPNIIKVVADIVGGAGRTYQFQLKGAYDLEVDDADYSRGVIPTGTFPASTTAGTIGAASLTISKATMSPSGDVVDTADDVEWAHYSFRAFGEPIKIETLAFRASVSDGNVGSLRDGRVLIGTEDNMIQYGSTQNLSATATTSFTVNYVVQPGEEVWVSVRADAFDNDGTDDLNAGDIVSILLEGGDNNNAEGLESGDQVDAPSSTIEGNNLTVATASTVLSIDNNYANQTVVLPQGSYKIGSWNLTGPNNEGINITEFSLDVDAVTGATFDQSDMADLFLMYGDTMSQTRGTVVANNNTFNISAELGANEVLPIMAFARLLDGGVTTGDSVKTDLSVSGTNKLSGSAVSGTIPDVDGQTISFGAGSLTVEKNNTTTDPVIVGDEQTVTALGMTWNAVNDTFLLKTINIDLAGDVSGISEVRLTDGTNTWSLPAQAEVIFNIPNAQRPSVAPGAPVDLTVSLVLGTIASPGGGNSGADHSVDFDASGSRVIASSTGVESSPTQDITGDDLYAYRAIPIVTRLALPSTVLTAGGQTATVAKFNIGSGGTGTIEWIQFILQVGVGNSVDALTNMSVRNSSNNTVAGVISSASGAITFIATDAQPAGDYSLRAQINGTTTGDDFVTVNWNSSGLTYVAPTASATVGGTSSLIWSDGADIGVGESSIDWSNDFLLKELDLDSWSLLD